MVLFVAYGLGRVVPPVLALGVVWLTYMAATALWARLEGDHAFYAAIASTLIGANAVIGVLYGVAGSWAEERATGAESSAENGEWFNAAFWNSVADGTLAGRWTLLVVAAATVLYVMWAWRFVTTTHEGDERRTRRQSKAQRRAEWFDRLADRLDYGEGRR